MVSAFESGLILRILKSSKKQIADAMYKNGEGIASDINVAKDLYAQAANLGHAMAMHELVKIYSAEGDQKQTEFWTKKYQTATNK